MVAVVVFCAVLGLVIVFQIALAAGAPWGRLAWGGRHPGVLPSAYRVASALAAPVYALLAGFALDLAGVLDLMPNDVSQIGMWISFGLLCLGVLANALSRSAAERWIMTPSAAVLAVLALLVALAGPVPHSFAGLVLDDGDGPVFCTTVMESYPPQCGADSPAVVGWVWSGIAHERVEDVRWGTYRFDGVKDGSTITIVGTPAPE